MPSDWKENVKFDRKSEVFMISDLADHLLHLILELPLDVLRQSLVVLVLEVDPLLVEVSHQNRFEDHWPDRSQGDGV